MTDRELQHASLDNDGSWLFIAYGLRLQTARNTGYLVSSKVYQLNQVFSSPIDEAAFFDNTAKKEHRRAFYTEEENPDDSPTHLIYIDTEMLGKRIASRCLHSKTLGVVSNSAKRWAINRLSSSTNGRAALISALSGTPRPFMGEGGYQSALSSSALLRTAPLSALVASRA